MSGGWGKIDGDKAVESMLQYVPRPAFQNTLETESRRESATYIREENTHVYTLSLK